MCEPFLKRELGVNLHGIKSFSLGLHLSRTIIFPMPRILISIVLIIFIFSCAENKDLDVKQGIKHHKAINLTKILKSLKEFSNFKNIHIHIYDNKANLLYSNKPHSAQIKQKLKTLHKNYIKNPYYNHDMLVTFSDLVFKGIAPIYDNNTFIGFVEVFTHFNSIAKKLDKQQVYSAIIVDKKYTPSNPFSQNIIKGYYISNLYLHKDVKDLLQKLPISYFTNIKNYEYQKINSKGYFITTLPLYHKKEIIAYYVIFIYDKYHLTKQENILHLIKLIMAILFMLMTYISYKEHIKNMKLISELDDKIKKEVNEKLSLLYKDTLTGAYKKIKFEEDKHKYLDKFIVMFNIKNFSKINELYGFKTGDNILKIITQRIENILKRKIYRINGDEFIFISDDIEYDIDTIKKYFIKYPIKLEQNNINLRISFSFAVVKNDGEEILRKLSIAIKEAKSAPFKKYIFYKEKPQEDHFLEFNELLYDAIFIHEKAQIIPFFQAIINNKTKQIEKYESLIRLKTKDKIYSPFFFLDIAKSSGFMFEITKIMIDKTLQKIANTDINVSINITEDDLLTGQLKDYLLEKVSKYNIIPSQITLEILEGITSSGTKNNIAQLNKLKLCGFKIAIDDFGVEYSNFERISELEIDFIKIDGKYIKNITNEKHYKIAKAITDFAHSLGIEVIAEFVENEEIQKIIEELGIDYSQGYYFSKPKEDF